MKTYVVYILASQPRGTLYIGVTNDLRRRMREHRDGKTEGFTQKYNVTRLVFVEQTEYIYSALSREKQLKRWHRNWKINLIEERNPEWNDLYESIFGPKEKMDPETSSG